ncbi:MAG: hypothetical protein U1D41_16400 [Nitrosomonas sp.]|uniref:hypothetical protein n=1 Tax=Nitrosomonas sp. TaxID=42353 RepID=UPI0027335F9E|nr:hypothetical protein [Nitrosomonas sp.]MDP3664383.1 hypothetical protein [Nitrosomonas sp.]MDZ4107694.1 hypothetical protein [Nitrosomonas sp.]
MTATVCTYCSSQKTGAEVVPLHSQLSLTFSVPVFALLPINIEEKMTEAPISAPPQAYMDIINPLIGKAREFLEAGEKLQAIAFVGNLTTKELIPVIIQSRSNEDKDQSAQTIQSVALALEADFVFVIMEAWALRPDKMHQMNAILEKYGSIGASPYAIDTCSLMLETWHGLWAAQPQIKTKGISKKKRTIGAVEFRYFTDTKGRFAHLLPRKAGDAPPAVLH